MPTPSFFMHRCLELAASGLGRVAPNPLVGCVIVHDDRIIGEGFHRRYGEVHAEVDALEAVKDQSLLKEATLHVNLEPCCHHGKTPPCTDQIIEAGIPEVVIGCRDPFHEVSGKGVRQLRKAGIEVTEQVEEEACRELNKRFFIYHQEERPYVILKWAQTADGFIDRERTPEHKGVNWITGHYAGIEVHKWRSQEQAIMVGTRTTAIDDPSLTVRNYHGTSPLRITLDRTLRLEQDLRFFDESTPTLIFTEAPKPPERENVAYAQLEKERPVLPQVLRELYRRKIQSLLVEGGSQLIESFLEAGLWDEARTLVGEKTFGKGKKAPVIRTEHHEARRLGKDQLLFYRNEQTAPFHSPPE